MASIFQPLEDVLGINTTAGTAQLQDALQALQQVGVPSLAQLTLPQLQQFVQAGVLTPQQYQAISANPQAYQQIAQQADQTGTAAQKSALQQLGGISQTGSTPIMQAQLYNALQQQNQANAAARGAVQQNAMQRGVAGGGQEFLNQLLGQQGTAQTANAAAVNAAANNAQLALQALGAQGNLGAGLQGQSNQMAQAQAQAAQQIAEYNSQLQSAANQYNVQNANQAQQMNLANAQNIANQNTQLANQRTMYNAALPQQVYQDQLQKAQGMAGIYGQQAGLAQQQAQQQNAFIGNMIGAGATLGGSYLAGQAGRAAANPGTFSSGATNIAQQNMPYSGSGNLNLFGGQTGTPNYPRISGSGQYQNFAMGGEADCYAEGGNTPPPTTEPQDQGKPNDLHSAHESHFAFPATNGIRIHLNPNDANEDCQVGKQYDVSIPMILVSKDDGGFRFNQVGLPHVDALGQTSKDGDTVKNYKDGAAVPGKAKVPGNSLKNDTVNAKLSPGEIVLPRTVAQAPNAPQKAAQFVQGLKPNVSNFSDALKRVQANTLEDRLKQRGVR